MIYSYIKSSNKQNLNIAIMGELQQSLGKNLEKLGHSVSVLLPPEQVQNQVDSYPDSSNNGANSDILILSTSLFFNEELKTLLLFLSQTKINSILFVCNDHTSLSSDKQTPILLKHFLLLLQRLGFGPCTHKVLADENVLKNPSIGLMFQRNHLPAWQIQSGIISFNRFKQLFFSCFGGNITPQDWDWKYGNDKGKSIVAYKDEKLIAYYGGVTRDISYFGEENKALQICDVMVDKQYQGILSKKGLFHQLAATFLENYIGYYAGYILGYGFPTSRVMKLAKRIKIYDKVDSLIELHWQAYSAKPHWFSRVRIVNASSQKITHQIEQLWQKMKNENNNSIIGVRNWDYLEYRFCKCPAKQYQLFTIQGRFTSELKGLFVLRYLKERNLWMLVDLVGTRANFTLIIQQALRVVNRLGGEKMVFWITQSHHQYLPDSWVEKKELDIDIPCNIWTAGPSVEKIKNKWWLTAGDADFM